MIQVKAPQQYKIDKKIPIIFLAGSIEMNKATLWQNKIVEALKDYDCLILNPRRDDYDVNQKQDVNNPYFEEQLEWDHDGLDAADIVLFYFEPNTKSPITLEELGLVAHNVFVGFKKSVVLCPEGFWRKGNVDYTVRRYDFDEANSFEELIEKAKFYIKQVVEDLEV